MTLFFKFKKWRSHTRNITWKIIIFTKVEKWRFLTHFFSCFFGFFSLFSKSNRNESESLCSLRTWSFLGHFWSLFFDPFLVLPGYFQGAFWRPLILGVSKSVIFGIKNNRELNSKFWSIWVDFVSPFLHDLPSLNPEKTRKMSKKCQKRGQKRGQKGVDFGSQTPSRGSKMTPILGSIFSGRFLDFQMAPLNFCQKSGFPSGPKIAFLKS